MPGAGHNSGCFEDIGKSLQTGQSNGWSLPVRHNERPRHADYLQMHYDAMPTQCMITYSLSARCKTSAMSAYPAGKNTLKTESIRLGVIHV